MRKLGLFALLLLAACTSDYVWQKPPHFPEPPPFPANNLQTEAGVALGKALFFDTRLSANNRVSCATCHVPQLAFTDATALSRAGVSGKALLRHAPTLVNVAYMPELFWDGGAKNLESLVFSPLTHPDEMAQDLKELVTELNQDPTYKRAFAKAFGKDSIYSAAIARALAQYMRTLISANTRYDSMVLGQLAFTAQEQAGWELFRQKCAGCHTPPLFTNNRFRSNGLPAVFSTDNLSVNTGRFRVTEDSADLGKYKVPTLRNVWRTAPYMHDGRFATLQQVLQHYQSGMVQTSFPDSVFLLPNRSFGLTLTAAEQTALLTFLKTLNDAP